LAAQPPPVSQRGAQATQPWMRPSHALEQFVDSIRDRSGLSILDLGALSQANVSFITNLGHRLYSVDFLRTLDEVSVEGDPPGGPSQRNRMEELLEQTLGYEADSFDGALIWDALDFVSRPLLLAAVERLHEILHRGAYLLAFFHTARPMRALSS